VSPPSAAYRAEADALDARILAAIGAYAHDETGLDDAALDALACEVFAHQFRWNAAYADYARSLGVRADALPQHAGQIPAVPAAAFKEAALCTVPAERAALWFETSGTTEGRSGRHYLESAKLYEAALLAGFDRALLADGAHLRYMMLVPDPRERPHSSLGFMMATIERERGDGAGGWFLHDDRLDVDGFLAAVAAAHTTGTAICVATTAFALVALLDELETRGVAATLPPASRVMETGGFKGRTRIVGRDELYTRAAAAFGLDSAAIVAEYGMTELSSQYYDAAGSRRTVQRIKQPAPWLRPIVISAAGTPLPPGVVGAIRHVDIANRSSVVAIDTEDLGVLTTQGLVLIGREQGAALRGCSLDAEALLHATRAIPD
jgi:alkylhydroperoxidase family enzyme